MGMFAFKFSAVLGRKALVVLGNLIVTLSLPLIGPSNVFPFSKNLLMMMVGEVMLGLGLGMWALFAFPIAQTAALSNFPDR